MARNKLSEPEKHARYVISKNLKKLTNGMTQQQLSEKTGIPASTLSGYFAQRSTPNAGALQKIADALNVKKSDIDPRYVIQDHNTSSIENENALKNDLNALEKQQLAMFRSYTDDLSQDKKEEYVRMLNPIMKSVKELVIDAHKKKD